jgi:hypothetical protein
MLLGSSQFFILGKPKYLSSTPDWLDYKSGKPWLTKIVLLSQLILEKKKKKKKKKPP